MDDLPSDLLIHIVSYLNVIDVMHLSASSKRMFYLANELPKVLGPEFAGACSVHVLSPFVVTPKEVLSSALSKIRTKPNLAFWFHSVDNSTDAEKARQLESQLPDNTILLGAIAGDIQANVPEMEPKSHITSSLLLGSFSRSYIRTVPFCMRNNAKAELDEFAEKELHGLESVSADYWKVFVVYSCGDLYFQTESFVQKLQSMFPNAAIVGGVCEEGYVSLKQNTNDNTDASEPPSTRRRSPRLRSKQQRSENQGTGMYRVSLIENGIFGVAMGGNVPMKSVVSRGVKSVVNFDERPSPWRVYESELSLPTRPEMSYSLHGVDDELIKPVHIIHSLVDIETDGIIDPIGLLRKVIQGRQPSPEFVGLRRNGEDGYELFQFALDRDQNMLVITDGSPRQEESLKGASIDLFVLDGGACCTNMESTLGKLEAATKNDKLLGAIMFSCNGRGPHPSSFIHEKMADAKRFKHVFPHVPCFGFYAGGEIGPMALADNNNVFQSGRAAIQGYTAVFALFIVPKEPEPYLLDDGKENVQAYLDKKLKND